MARSSTNIDVYVEIGKKRTVAGALDWPGWCRIGRDEAGALQALADAGPRYARVGHAAQLAFQPPPDVSAFAVVERLAGTATTDFGVPDVAPSRDARQVDDADLRRFQALIQASWRAFDRAVEAATGQELRKGPRGGGHDLDGSSGTCWAPTRATWRGSAGRSSGARRRTYTRRWRGWAPRYVVRRVAWHALDHAWALEDRLA